MIYETLSYKRQYRCIGELKQEQAAPKNQQLRTLPQVHAASSRGAIGGVVMRCSAGATEVNIGCLDAGESNEQWQSERNDQEKYRPVREDISDQAHQPRCGKTARRGKALITSKPFGQSRMTDQAKTDRGDRRPKDPAADSPVEVSPVKTSEKVGRNARIIALTVTTRAPTATITRFEGVLSSNSHPAPSKQAGKGTSAEDKTDVLLCPVLVG